MENQKQVVYNHEAESYLEAVGADENMRNNLAKIMAKISEKLLIEDYSKSQVHEHIRHNLSYEELLMIATEFAFEKTKEIHHEMLKSKLKEISDFLK